MNSVTKIEYLKKSPIFKNLAETELAKISKVSIEKKFMSGEIIFEENSNADAFYIICEGEVEILKKIEKRGYETLALKKAVDVFGEMAVIDDLPRSATIRAKTDIITLKLDKDIFNELLMTSYLISLEIARSVSSTIRATNTSYINDLEKETGSLNQL